MIAENPAGCRPCTIAWPPAGPVIDRRGHPVNVASEVWTIVDPMVDIRLHWGRLDLNDCDALRALKRRFAWLITNQAPFSVRNAFEAVIPFVASKAFRSAASEGTVIPYLAFSEAKALLRSEEHWRLHHARQLYRWCAVQGFRHFSQDVAKRLDDVIIGGNVKGQAVRSRDPDKGPLNAQVVAALSAALREVRAEGTMPLAEQAALWLALSTGSNPGQYACIREEDLAEEKVSGQTVAWIISIPRHKKGHDHYRADFRDRKLQRFVGLILRDLIEENKRKAPPELDGEAARPLFRRKEPAKPYGEWSWHLLSGDFTRIIQRAVKTLRVRSRAGKDLRVNTRRFRYSLGTRLVNAGASMLAVADALDHSDTQNVQVYFDVHSDIVEHLDRSMAFALAPRAQALTRIVASEHEAERGDVKGSRRFFGDKEKDVFEPIGTCGSYSFCNVHAPLACYTCHRFQPWIEGPHDLVLDSLLEARDRRLDQGLSAKLVTIEDEIIAAVADVITRIADLRVADDVLPRNHAIGKVARQMETSDAARPIYRGSDHWRAGRA